MTWIVVDVEADGPVPGLYSMTELGAVVVEPEFRSFYGTFQPISDKWIPDALAVSGKTREWCMQSAEPKVTMYTFTDWIRSVSKGQPIFVSDNNGFDWGYVNYYFHAFTGKNPFGFSSRRIGDLYCGMVGDTRAKWKHLRKTNHTHNPVDDARGNAEVLLHMRDEMGLKVRF